MHLSVKYNQFEAAKFIAENFKELINMKDGSGNTALHLATARRHSKVNYCSIVKIRISLDCLSKLSRAK